MNAKIKILFFASNPENVTQLHLDEEIRSITKKIQASDYHDSLDLISAWAVRPDDLLQELNARKPTIVHFSGHGSGRGELVLMNDLRQAKTVSPSALKALFSTLKDNVRLVVLNACFSKTQAAAIAEVIDCVVGMNTSIGDQAAITFAASFYRAIGFGRSVKEAVEQGRVSLMLEDIAEENTPELLARQGVDPAAVYLVDVKRSDTVLKKVRTQVGKPLPPNESIPYQQIRRATIDEPCTNQLVGRTIRCSGIATDVQPQMHLWLAVEAAGLIWPKEGEVFVDKENRWSGTIFEDGATRKFSVALLIASPEGDRLIREWLEDGRSKGEYAERKGIPGTERLARVDGLRLRRSS